MSALCFLYLFLKLVTELAIFIVEGILFHSSTTLIEKKFLLTSSRAACCLKFSGPVALLVVKLVWSALTKEREGGGDVIEKRQ
jgi:hypothetical protein